MNDNKLTGVSDYARDLVSCISDYHKETRYIHPSLQQCRQLFSQLKGINDVAIVLVKDAERCPGKSDNPVVNSILVQARRYQRKEFDTIELARRLERASQIYGANPQWSDFIKKHDNAVPYSVPLSYAEMDAPESQDPRYWGDMKRAQASVQSLLESVQKYHETRDRFNVEAQHLPYSDYNLHTYTMAQNDELNVCFQDIQKAIDLLKEYSVRFERVKIKNPAVEAIVRYVLQALEDGFGLSAIANEMKKAADQYNQSGESYFNQRETETTFPRLPISGIYLLINYPPEAMPGKKFMEYREKMSELYKDMIAGRSSQVSCDLNSFLLKVQDVETARKIAVADTLCYNFCTFKAEYLTYHVVKEALVKIEEEKKEEYVGKVVPFSRMETGTQMYRAFVEDGLCTHIFTSAASKSVMFLTPHFKNIIHDPSGGMVWPVSPEELKAEAAAVAAARQVLQQQPAAPGGPG
jgi:hypothetical protein